jgi:hypothetical protein
VRVAVPTYQVGGTFDEKFVKNPDLEDLAAQFQGIVPDCAIGWAQAVAGPVAEAVLQCRVGPGTGKP